MPRLDAHAKATGALRYLADIAVPGLCHAAVARSTVAHAEIVRIDTSVAAAQPGVVGVFTADDVTPNTYGRSVCDVPILARGKVRFVGEQVAAVVAETRAQAEQAAALVEIVYRELPTASTIEEAFAPGATALHDAPWDYPHPALKAGAPTNVQAMGSHGDRVSAEAALAGAAHVIDAVYETPAVHQGYLEPWGCIAHVEGDQVHLWVTNKASHLLRSQLGELLGRKRESIVIEPIPVGADFGGKGSAGEAPLCIELSRLTGRPVRIVFRYFEELTATNPRHPSRTRIRMGCDEEGRLVGAIAESFLDGGAYAGFNPTPGPLHGSLEPGGYRIPAYFAESRIAYTNTVPKGNMRAPGSPQCCFAFESAIDELAVAAGIDPFEFRRRNILVTGDSDAFGHAWRENRGLETLDATKGDLPELAAPEGWLVGEGWSVYSRITKTETIMSLRLVEREDGGIRIELPVTDTGTGSYTVMREIMAKKLGCDPASLEIVHVSTAELPRGLNAGGSRVTSTLSMGADYAAKAWAERGSERSVTLDLNEPPAKHPLGSFSVQHARVAVDPATGQVAVLSISSGIDVAEIINAKAHQMQVDGGTAMGYGFACLEDLDEREGQVWAANLGEFKIPSMRDLPALTTTLVRGGIGVGDANIKNIGELTTPPTAAAIANAVCDATGCRMRELPITAERLREALGAPDRGATPVGAASLA